MLQVIFLIFGFFKTLLKKESMRGSVLGKKGKQLVNTFKHKNYPSLRFSKIFCIGLMEINESTSSTLNSISVPRVLLKLLSHFHLAVTLIFLSLSE